MKPTLSWRLTSRTGLLWRHYEDQSLVFNPSSGDTHLLDHVSRTGLACIEKGALTGEELCQQMIQKLELQAEENLRPYVSRLLNQLRELGLVERASP